MSLLTEDDEAFIQQFVGLSTDDLESAVVAVPKKAISSTNWDLCLLARIVTDRIVLDGPFAKAMITAWEVDPATTVRQVIKNYYLFEFNSIEDFRMAQLGVWTYRGDLVALRQVTSDSDLNLAMVDQAVVRVLFMNLPVNEYIFSFYLFHIYSQYLLHCHLFPHFVRI